MCSFCQIYWRIADKKEKTKQPFFRQKITCFYYGLVRFLLNVDDEAIGMSRYLIELSLRAYTIYGDWAYE